MANQINTIIFDLGGVLIDWNPRYMYRKIFNTEEEIEYFLANICTGDWNEQQDGGRTLKEGTEVLIAKFPEQEANIRAFYDRWEEMVGGAIEPTVELLTKLYQDKKYRLVALTNWSAETWYYAIENFPFLQYFEGILVSGEEMMKKPDARIYELILSRYNIDRTKAVFIDDNPHNIAGSEAVGLKAIQFQTTEQVKKDLRALGVQF